MKLKLLSSLCALALVFTLAAAHSPEASAQGGKLTVTGVVIDEFGDPMIGAGVLVKNTVIGVTTNLDGEYTIQVDAIGGTRWLYLPTIITGNYANIGKPAMVNLGPCYREGTDPVAAQYEIGRDHQFGVIQFTHLAELSLLIQ